MKRTLLQAVRTRAAGRCEYCQLPEAASKLTFGVDHITPKQHHGGATLDNLALACPFCNRHKGPNLTGVDPVSGRITTLFNPRVDLWPNHFRWRGPVLEGITDIGRATIDVLVMNGPLQLAVRAALIE